MRFVKQIPIATKVNKVLDSLIAFRIAFPRDPLDFSYFPPSGTDHLLIEHTWPEGISVFEREGKKFIYFRDLEEFLLFFEIYGQHSECKSPLPEKYLSIIKCKQD